MDDLDQKVKDLSAKLIKIKESSNLPEKQKELLRLETKSLDPTFWNNQEEARRTMQNLDNLKKEIVELGGLEADISVLTNLLKESELTTDFKDEINELAKRINKLEIKSFLAGEYDPKDAILSIHAGQGGTEAMDWASMLYRMYLRYCERKNWETETVDLSEGEEAGIKSITLRVKGPYAYGFLKGEA